MIEKKTYSYFMAICDNCKVSSGLTAETEEDMLQTLINTDWEVSDDDKDHLCKDCHKWRQVSEDEFVLEINKDRTDKYL